MNTVIVKLSQVKVNGDNPRTITNDKLNKLINSILVFPKMLGIRPVVVDDKMVALGGNMRLNALKLIAKMTPEELGTRLATIADYLKKSAGERENIARHWEAWLQKPTVEIIKANELTEDERKQFMIKDNVSVGDWDWQQLEAWDEQQLQDWGVGVEMPDFGNSEQNLPEELQGHDLIPDELEKLQGRDETLMQRVIITYKPEQEKEVADMLGLDEIEKVVYKFDELNKS